MLYVSSDYVFDGTKGEPYVESDATGPLSSYGRSKLAGELATAAANPRHFIVRSSWLFGAGGKNFVDTMLRLGERARRGARGGGPGGLPHLHGPPGRGARPDRRRRGLRHPPRRGRRPVLLVRVRERRFERAGVDCRLEPITAAEYPLPAPRPAYSVLGTEREPLLPPWQEGLDAYLAEREVRA